MNPRIKRGISVLHKRKRSGYEVSFFFSASSTVCSCLLNDGAFRCLGNLKGELTLTELAFQSGITEDSARKLIKTLEKLGVLSYETNELTPSFHRRLRNQINFLGDFERSGLTRFLMQERISKASVCVIGAGGIGSWVSYGLALSGIGCLVIIDPDKVEIGNLGRQALYTNNDIGYSKAERLALHLKDISPDIKSLGIIRRVESPSELVGIVANTNLVINCADEPEVDTMNRIVSESCFSKMVPHILCGGYDGHLSFLGPTVVPYKTPCWFCYEKKIDRQKKMSGLKHLLITESDQQGGSIAPVSAITANYHVLEALKVISGWASPTMSGRVAEIDFTGFSITFTRFSRYRGCKQCGRR